MNIIKDDNAISPVIGVIILVAITVILAGVIAVFLFEIDVQPEEQEYKITNKFNNGHDYYFSLEDQNNTKYYCLTSYYEYNAYNINQTYITAYARKL